MRNNDKPVNSIAEVVDYYQAKGMLELFMEHNKQIFSVYNSLVASLEQKREVADKIVRAQGISCGDWELYQYQKKYDAVKLYEAVGQETFLKIGGKLMKVTEYDIDKVKLQAAIASKQISKEIADQVITKSPRYHAPTPIK